MSDVHSEVTSRQGRVGQPGAFYLRGRSLITEVVATAPHYKLTSLQADKTEWRITMLRLKGPKSMAAALLGGIALLAASFTDALADDWKGKGHGWGHGPGHGHGQGHGHGWKKKHGHGDWDDDRPRVIVRNGYYYAPPPRVYYAPPPRIYYAPPPPPPVYYAPAPVYVQPQPAISLQFRL